jgi:hypothetical protein
MDPSMLVSLGQIAGGIFGMSDYNNPASAAQPYLNQISGANQQYLNPYNQIGQQAGGSLQGQYNQLLNNPGGMLNKIGQGYHQSPGFNFALSQALHGANQGMASGGMAGSPMAQQQNMGVATGMANQDYYNWLNNATGMYGKGLQGMQGMYGIGENAGNNMANNISQALSQQAAYGYAGQNAANQNQASGWGDIFSGLFG